MVESTDTRSGWYVRRWTPNGDSQGGPYTWDQLLEFSRRKPFGPADTVWHPTLPGWVSATTVLGLAPVQPPAPVPSPAAAAAQQVAPQPRKRRAGIIALVLVLFIVAGGGAAGAWWFLGRDGGSGTAKGPSLGASDTKLPDAARLVDTTTWGEVPANQVCVVMAADARSSDAEKVAKAIGGRIVGEVAFVNLYQIEFEGVTESDLTEAIGTAEAQEKVDYAYPNDQVELDAEIWGTRVDPYEDPVYGGGAGNGYKNVGVGKAWTYIRGAGIDLNDVKVGVVDDGLYMPGDGNENEFEGDGPKVEFPDPQAGELPNKVLTHGKLNAAGSHGTGVSTVIGANPGNGGPAGVAGPLGKKLTISMVNQYGGKYGDTTAAPDPEDPTKQVWYDGKTYSIGSLVALTKQIESGAKVINCSWGNSNADPKDVETYKRFFTKMAEKHPDVLFVCSGGNGGKEMDGSKRYPSGLALPNMITVGALDNDGKQATYADWASDDYEVTLGAPGTGAVVGIGDKGGAIRQDGSSFAAPHVTAAAAILKSINPKLSAGQIKAILTSTARASVLKDPSNPDAGSTNIAPEMGGKMLALDQAVLKVINDMRKAKGLPELTPEVLEQMGVIDAVAITGEPGEYTVKGIVKAAGEKGVDVKIEVFGENSAVGGKTEQSLKSAGDVKWSVTLPKDEGTIKVTRLDNGAASVIDIQKFDLNGTWEGTYTLTDLKITDEEAAKEEGCSLALAEALLNQPLPATLEVTVDENGQGSGVLTIDASKIDEEAEATPNAVTISQSGSQVHLTFGETGVEPMTMSVTRSGDTLTMTGSIGGGGPGFTWTAVMSFSKPYTQ